MGGTYLYLELDPTTDKLGFIGLMGDCTLRDLNGKRGLYANNQLHANS